MAGGGRGVLGGRTTVLMARLRKTKEVFAIRPLGTAEHSRK